jgi:hypothetical protein
MVPGVQGPHGQPIAMAAPYSYAPPSGKEAAMAMIQNSMPLEMLQQAGYTAGMPANLMQAQAQGTIPGAMPQPGPLTPPGVPMMPGGPMGTGIMQTSAGGPPGAVAAIGALTGGTPARYAPARTEVRFAGPNGMKVSWYTGDPSGKGGFSMAGIEAPGRYNFTQAAIYRLKLSNIPGRPALDLYPTLEVVPVNNKTATFLAHSAVPVSFTEEDFEQVTSGNYVVKVVYLPDREHQDLAVVGADEVVSTRLEPGADPIAEACKRGSILLVVRLGNIDLELQNSPPMDAPNAYQQHQPPAAPRMQGAMGNSPMVPYGMGGPGRATATPGAMLPPANGATPAVIPPQQPSGPGVPVSRLPDLNMIQQAGKK